MKVNLILKIAIVAMATFGAYAFNGNNVKNSMELYSVKDGDVCTPILADCANSGNFTCSISRVGVQPVYDIQCMQEIKHDTNNLVNWEPGVK